MAYQELNYKAYQKAKKLFEKTEQASEPDMADMLEIAEWEFKTTLINVLSTLMGKVDSMQEHVGSMEVMEAKNVNPKKKTKKKKNTGGKKCCNRDKECLWWAC